MNLSIDRTQEIKNELALLNHTLKMSVQKAIRIGELLTEQKEFVGHGNFLSWINSNLDISERTARNYMSLFSYRDKTANIADLHSAYQQIENLEAQERQSKDERQRSMIAEFRKTGVKPTGWTAKHDKAVRDTDEHLAKIKAQREQEEAAREQRAKEYKEKREAFSQTAPPPDEGKPSGGESYADAFKIVADTFIQHTNKRNEWKEKIRLSDGGKEDAFMDAIIDYMETLPDDNRRIEACNNIIKICRNIAVELQKSQLSTGK
jgi:Protein of unknown function (DUF3102).